MTYIAILSFSQGSVALHPVLTQVGLSDLSIRKHSQLQEAKPRQCNSIVRNEMKGYELAQNEPFAPIQRSNN
jgi:hypothetical protein